jgi:hypothetical protein
MPKTNRPEFEAGERPQGLRSRRARIGYGPGTELRASSMRGGAVACCEGEEQPGDPARER